MARPGPGSDGDRPWPSPTFATGAHVPAKWSPTRTCAKKSSGGGPVDSLGGDQRGEALAGIEHAGLHRVLRDAEDLDDLLDRLVLVVHQVDDLGMLGGERGEAAADHGAGVLLAERGLGRTAGVDH